MKRNISSKWTLPTKIFNFVVAIFPLVCLPVAYRELGQDGLLLRVLAVSLIVSWSLFFLFINYRLKFVSVDENNLYVSRLWRETAIPLSEIEGCPPDYNRIHFGRRLFQIENQIRQEDIFNADDCESIYIFFPALSSGC